MLVPRGPNLNHIRARPGPESEVPTSQFPVPTSVRHFLGCGADSFWWRKTVRLYQSFFLFLSFLAPCISRCLLSHTHSIGEELLVILCVVPLRQKVIYAWWWTLTHTCLIYNQPLMSKAVRLGAYFFFFLFPFLSFFSEERSLKGRGTLRLNIDGEDSLLNHNTALADSRWGDGDLKHEHNKSLPTVRQTRIYCRRPSKALSSAQKGCLWDSPSQTARCSPRLGRLTVWPPGHSVWYASYRCLAKRITELNDCVNIDP